MCTVNMADRSHLFTSGVTHVRVSDLYLELRQGVYFPVGDGPGVMWPKVTACHWISQTLHQLPIPLRFLANCNEHMKAIICACCLTMLNPLRFFSSSSSSFLNLSLIWLFCDPMDYSWPGSSFHGISQVRILEWVTISFSRGSSGPRDPRIQLTVPSLAGRLFTTEPPGKPQTILIM